MASRYLSLSVNSMTVEQQNILKEKLDDLKDWVKFHGNYYIIYTSVDTDEIYNFIKERLPDCTFMIMRVSAGEEYNGWVKKVVVDWLAKERDDSIPGR